MYSSWKTHIYSPYEWESHESDGGKSCTKKLSNFREFVKKISVNEWKNVHRSIARKRLFTTAIKWLKQEAISFAVNSAIVKAIEIQI